MYTSSTNPPPTSTPSRLVAAKVIPWFILHAKKTGLIVEYDFIMATYLSPIG
jgi:translation initiation factor RLI1